MCFIDDRVCAETHDKLSTKVKTTKKSNKSSKKKSKEGLAKNETKYC
jgi:hypothetical protein